MNAPCSGAPLTAPHVTTEGLYRWKTINKVGRHVGLDFYDLLIEGDYTHNAVVGEMVMLRQLLLPRDLRPAADQIEDKDVTLHDCGVIKYPQPRRIPHP